VWIGLGVAAGYLLITLTSGWALSRFERRLAVLR
jgi:hypothetical protein